MFSSPLTPITKSAYDPLLEVLIWLTYLQGTVDVKNKIETLRPRVAALDKLFVTPPGDIEEQRRRSELLRYVFVHPLYPTLSFPQRARGYRGAIVVAVWRVGIAGVH